MKKIYLLATTIVALASCTSDNFVGSEEEARLANGETPISFGSGVPAMTRADKTGSAAATDLNNQFFVYAIKNESTDGAGNVQDGNLVFNNYVVKWTDNTAYTTTSNTKNWEYVGYTLTAKEQAKVTANGGTTAQTIKYWDFGATDYTFYAFSALPADIEGDKITVTKVQNQKTTDVPAHTVYDNGYSVTLAADADLDHLFFAERQPITQSNNTDRTQANKYGGNVTFRFHNTASKVRAAMYETVPGYSVTINKFSVDNDGANPTFGDMTDDVTANFAANLQNCAKGTAGTLTVKYVADAGATQNHPTVSFDGTKNKVLTLGDNLAASKVLTTTAPDAIFDKSDKSYTSVFPNETNTQNLKLKLSYTLTAVDPEGNATTGETIAIADATAEVPANYLKWKPGYAYTYIFKITDDKLYPITFDAVEVVDEDGLAEYITTVSEPSITTFGVNTSTNKYITGSNEYPASTDVYATVEDASVNPILSGTNMKLYTVTTSDATNFPITEASVAEALIEGPTWTKAQSDNKKITCTTSSLEYVNNVPAEDGTTIGMDGTNNKAAKFTTAASTVYALVYEKTAATYTVEGGQTYADEAAFNNAGVLYTNSGCTEVASWVNESTTYYKRTAVSNKGVYAIKIVRVAP